MIPFNLITLKGKNINVYFTKRLYNIWAYRIGNIFNELKLKEKETISFNL